MKTYTGAELHEHYREWKVRKDWPECPSYPLERWNPQIQSWHPYYDISTIPNDYIPQPGIRPAPLPDEPNKEWTIVGGQFLQWGEGNSARTLGRGTLGRGPNWTDLYVGEIDEAFSALIKLVEKGLSKPSIPEYRCPDEKELAYAAIDGVLEYKNMLGEWQKSDRPIASLRDEGYAWVPEDCYRVPQDWRSK